MKKFTKNKWLIFALLILAFLVGCYWFFGKLFPAQTGEWSKKTEADFKDSAVPSSGWQQDPQNKNSSFFWTSLDFPGMQKICLDIHLKQKAGNSSKIEVPVVQAPRDYFYSQAGTLSDFFAGMTPIQVEEKIRQGNPYFIGHLFSNVERIGKDIFFLGENEKFLIPTKSVFDKRFPNREIPAPTGDPSSLPYANVLINFPDGILLTDGQGVFVISQGKLFLIRSPEVFEALGYKWEDIIQMDNYDKAFNSYLSGNLIDFNTAHPNGTLITNEKDRFLVWDEKLYRLTPEEQASYFPNQKAIAMHEKALQADCLEKQGSDLATCCVSGVDPRLNPPAYDPFLNTLKWDLARITNKNETASIDWQSKIFINRENILRRLSSLKNFVLYGLGIVK